MLMMELDLVLPQHFAGRVSCISCNVGFCSTITVMTSLVALSFYGASQLKFHWVERYDKLLVGSVLCLVGVLTLIFHDHDHDGHGSSTAGQLNRKLIVL
ncbi:hypothetical protein CK203_062877 [Vitis vinifera]|uniref:Uncharacterized protein n=1 Tax=Vitis vinifera TaxID=29760 RepID=A0A438FLT5_VITVI|nr:hypothetical protein CK203_051357 [Vitis vinifera]RVW62339.1 hypothetical protein CK203_062877 [Vitis vinifera]